MADQSKKLQVLSDEYEKIQEALQAVVVAREKLESQRQENLGVQKEFAGLRGDANIYRLIGPALLKQEKDEAVLAVESRLGFIGKEIIRIEEQIADVQEKSERKKNELFEHQTQMQQGEEGAQAKMVSV